MWCSANRPASGLQQKTPKMGPSSYESLSKYSSGTSSSGTSRVRTSCSSASSARCTPETMPASKAFPSSSNSSTLSESARSRRDTPCRSPDCPALRVALLRERLGPAPRLLPRDELVALRAAFLVFFFLLRVVFDLVVFDVACVLVFFLLLLGFLFFRGIPAVYHPRGCLRTLAHSNPTRPSAVLYSARPGRRE